MEVCKIFNVKSFPPRFVHEKQTMPVRKIAAENQTGNFKSCQNGRTFQLPAWR